MTGLDKGKEAYENIRIPEELGQSVEQTVCGLRMRKKAQERRRRRAAILVAMTGLTACQAKGAEEDGQTSPDTDIVRFGEDGEDTGMDTDETESVQADTAEAGTEESVPSRMTDNFSVDPGAVEEYAASIKEAVAQKDMEKLADLTGFPVYVGLEGVDVVDTREDFLALDPSAVFSEELCSAVEQVDASGLEASKAGFTLMGETGPGITFGVVNGELRIIGINY